MLFNLFQKADYLIFITSRKRVARVLGSDIYLAKDFKVFPIDSSLSSSAVNAFAGLHQPNETFLLSLVKGHLYSGPFYFTTGDYDITSRLQVQDLSSNIPHYARVRRSFAGLRQSCPNSANCYESAQADDRFFWNKYLQTRLIDLAGKQQGGGDVSMRSRQYNIMAG